MEPNKEKLKKLSCFLSKINRGAYKDIYLLSNEVLSKNPLTNTLLEDYIACKPVRSVSSHILFGKLVTYYAKSTLWLCMYLLNMLSYFISRQKFNLNTARNQLILVHTFFLIKRIQKEKAFNDPYFPGLEKVLKKLGKTFAYVPAFYPTVTPLRLYRILRLLRKKHIPVLTEFQLLSRSDLSALVHFLLCYPFYVLKFAHTLRNDSYESRLLKYELLNTIDHVTVSSFARYLQGKKISSIACSNIKFISWYENQVIHKNMYKGLRKGKTKVLIYGAQLFVYSTSLLNIPVDEAEVSCGIIPDKILVNGTHYMPKDNTLHYAVGPSFRYKQLFETRINFETRENLLVLLPYHGYEIVNVLKIIGYVDWPQEKMFIKFHPTTNKKTYKNMVPRKAKIVEGSIYDLFQTTKIAIGAESGGLLEAASLAIPAIIVKNPTRFTHNPFPEHGKGIIWGSGQSAKEVNALIRKFDVLLTNEKEAILRFADDYKAMFFCEVTKEKIIEVFDLK